jgi:hypothetical protein
VNFVHGCRVLAAVAAFGFVSVGIVQAQDGTPSPASGDFFDPAVPEATPIAGIERFEVESADHTEEPVDYPQDPPAGGDHYPAWQKCQVYDEPIPNEPAVHSQEHGAVWLTYQPDLPEADVEALAAFSDGQRYVLISPYPDLDSPIVASAWGAQLRLDDVDDPRLPEFIARFAGNGPEPGATCDSGLEETLADS